MKTFIHVISGLDIVVDGDPSGGFYAVVPGLPGCGSQGEFVSDTLANLDDAIMTVLDILGEDDPERLQFICGAITRPDVAPDSAGSLTMPGVEMVVQAA